MRRAMFVGVFITIAIISIVVWRQRPMPASNATCYRCNIVVIVIDSLRADALPCYGYALNTAPNLCRFAKNNLQFTKMYANATWTRPSNMSIFTSLYPLSHGLVEGSSKELSPKVFTLPQLLFQAGYDTTEVINDQHNIAIDMGFGRGFKHITLTGPVFDDTVQQSWLTAIDSIQKANQQNKPAFVFFHSDHVHEYLQQMAIPPKQFPLDPTFTPSIVIPQEFTDETWKLAIQYLDGSIPFDWGGATIQDEKSWLNKLQNARSLTQAKQVFAAFPQQLQSDLLLHAAQSQLANYKGREYIALARHLYDESIRTADIFFAKLLDRVSHDGLKDNTIIVVVSDHGQLLGEEGYVGHIFGMRDEEIHVPFILRIPGTTPRATSQLTQLIDIAPTILDIVGVTIPKQFVGISLQKLLQGKQDAPYNTFVISQTEYPDHANSLQTDAWRLIETTYPQGVHSALYNLEKDAKQAHSVVDAEQVTRQRLHTLLHEVLQRQPIYQPIQQTFPIWYDEKDRQQKIDEGYFFGEKL